MTALEMANKAAVDWHDRYVQVRAENDKLKADLAKQCEIVERLARTEVDLRTEIASLTNVTKVIAY